MQKNIFPVSMRQLVLKKPQASAHIRGSADYPDIHGTVTFAQSPLGVMVTAHIDGLPIDLEICGSSIFALHIHAGSACSGNSNMPFANALGHFNPRKCPHPYHAGDLPPLFSSKGFAWYSFLSDRFSINEIIGKTVIIHSRPDDFTTQPSGNPGDMIACGVIERILS